MCLLLKAIMQPLNVFSVIGLHLKASWGDEQMFHSFEKTWPPQEVGSPASFHMLQTLLLTPRIPLFITVGLRSSWFLHLSASLVVIEMDFCCVPSGLSGGTCHGWRSITALTFPDCSSSHLRGRNRCPETPFLFGLDQPSTMLMHLPQRRSADRLESGRKVQKVAVSLLLGEIAQSIRY